MSISISEMMAIASRLFPVGYWPDDDKTSPEYHRRAAAWAEAQAHYPTWKAMLRRLSLQLPNAEVRNESLRMEAADSAPTDRCFMGAIYIRPVAPIELEHRIGFRASFVVPYYYIYSSRVVKPHADSAPIDADDRTSFEFSPDEAPIAAAVEEEIHKTLPTHKRMGPEIGMKIVPDVSTNLRIPGEATLFDCLFSDYW
ncbi:MAG: hypothetical protein R3B70_11495 [Polyangiaceae bacterium]